MTQQQPQPLPNPPAGNPARPATRTQTRLALDGGLLPGGDDPAIIPVRVVRAGRTGPIRSFPHGLVITAEALQEGIARGLFDGVAVFFRHVPDQGRDVRDLAGVTHDARWDEGEGAVVADVHTYHNAAGNEFAILAGDFRRHREQGIAHPDVGVSMDSFFTIGEGDPPRTTSLTRLSSVDIVFRPAADGRILAAVAQGDLDPSERPDLPPCKPANLNTRQGGIPMPQEATTPQEGSEAAAESAAPTTITVDLSPPGIGRAEADNAQLWLSALREATVQVRLAGANLPRSVQARLANGTYQTPADLERAIKEARAELAQLAEENVVQIGNVPPRGPAVAGHMQTGLDQLGAAVEWIFGVKDAGLPEPQMRDIRTLYHTLTGDYEFHGMFRPERVVLTGATTATLADLAANAMNKVVVQQFSYHSAYRWYEHVAYPTPNDGSVQDMQWTVLGGIENLPAVPEKGAYGELDMADVAETDSFVKYGGYVPITLELIRNSNIQKLQAVPRQLATAAVRTRSAQVSAIFTANSGSGPTLDQDGVALFHTASHGNLATTAFGTDETAWRAAVHECYKQTEVNSGKRLAYGPKYGLFPIDLYHTALSVFGYGQGVPTTYEVFSEDRGPADPRPVPLSVPDWTDSNNWAYICDPQLFPVIHISYAQAPGGGSHPAPELYTVASPSAGLMFSNDVMPIKIRDWFAVGVNGYRGIGKRNVS